MRTPAPAKLAKPGGRLVAAAVVAAIVLVAGALAIGRFTAPVAANPSNTSAEAGFSRDMQVHHNQAVEMAMLIRDATDDPDVRLLAYDIATSQSNQSGQMLAWLNVWGLPQLGSEPSMTWMTRPTIDGSDDGHGHTGDVPGAMPGLATSAQMDALAAASGIDAEILFLELMIAHHQGGVEMAEAVLARSTNKVVTDLAGSIVTAQVSEITLMEDLLAARQR